MKKFVALLLSICMLANVVALAEETVNPEVAPEAVVAAEPAPADVLPLLLRTPSPSLSLSRNPSPSLLL